MAKKNTPCPPIIALGTMTFGDQTNGKDAERMMGAFLDAGHTWIDTAHLYTGGKSERIIGRFLKGRRREQAFLATKVYPNALKGGSRFGLRPKRVRASIDESLRRMKMDCVDLFYLHAPDNATPLEDTLGTCQELIAEGKVRELGLSNYASWQVAEIMGLCTRNDWQAPIIYQGMYNVVTRLIEEECIAACNHFGVDFIAYNPLAGGMLTGKHLDAAAAPGKGRFSKEFYRDRFWKAEYFEAVTLLARAAKRARMPLTDVALRWLVHHSQTNGILLGASKMAHFEQNLAACAKGPLSPAALRAADAAWATARPACQRYFRD